MTIPPGAGQDPIIADIGPAPARDALATLLNGSPFNFVIIGTDNDPSQLRGVFLTLRQGGSGDSGMSYPAVQAAQVRQIPDSGNGLLQKLTIRHPRPRLIMLSRTWHPTSPRSRKRTHHRSKPDRNYGVGGDCTSEPGSEMLRLKLCWSSVCW